MTFGIAVAAFILMYLSRRFPWFAALGALLCVIFIGGLLWIVWNFCYPNDLWYFWCLVSIGVGYWIFLVVLNKAIQDL